MSFSFDSNNFNIHVIPPLVLPALWLSHREDGVKDDQKSLSNFFTFHPFSAESLTIEGRLDALKYCYQNTQIIPPQDQKWVVYFQTNAMTYESSLFDVESLAKQLDANVLLFNYRGVGSSKGYPESSSDLVDDGAACMNYLLQSGVRIENIMAYGHSIGGAIAAEVLAREDFQKANLFADRTFNNFPSEASSYLSKKVPLVGSLAKSILVKKGWHFDGVENIQRIKGKKIVVNCPVDEMIEFSVSLLKGVSSKDAELIELTPKEGFKSTGIDFHMTPLTYSMSPFANPLEGIQKAREVLHPKKTT